jgi:hypothetical protein
MSMSTQVQKRQRYTYAMHQDESTIYHYYLYAHSNKLEEIREQKTMKRQEKRGV